MRNKINEQLCEVHCAVKKTKKVKQEFWSTFRIKIQSREDSWRTEFLIDSELNFFLVIIHLMLVCAIIVQKDDLMIIYCLYLPSEVASGTEVLKVCGEPLIDVAQTQLSRRRLKENCLR